MQVHKHIRVSVCCSWCFSLVFCHLWAAGCPSLGHLNCPLQRKAAKQGQKVGFLRRLLFFYVKYPLLEGETAAPLSEGPVNRFSRVTSCYPEAQGTWGHLRLIWAHQSQSLLRPCCSGELSLQKPDPNLGCFWSRAACDPRHGWAEVSNGVFYFCFVTWRLTLRFVRGARPPPLWALPCVSSHTMHR